MATISLNIRAAPTLPSLSSTEKMHPLAQHAEALTSWCRDGEKALRTLESAVNTARDSHVTAVSGNLTLAVTQGTTVVSAVAATVTLPSAQGVPGRFFTVKLTAVPTSGTSVKVAAVGAQTIDGAATFALSAQYKYVTVLSDGANWHVVANN